MLTFIRYKKLLNVFCVSLKNYRGLQDDKKPFGWSLGKLNHVAIATPNLEQATALYRDILGAKVSDPLPLPEHGVTTVFVELGNTKLELLLPLGADSPIKVILNTANE